MAPVPVRRPRIPVWIGAGGSYRAPRLPAARWDGFAPASEQWPLVVIPPATYAKMAVDLRGARASAAPYDVVVIGNADATEPTPAAIPHYERAGVTWVLVQALTVAARATGSSADHPPVGACADPWRITLWMTDRGGVRALSVLLAVSVVRGRES
jgi:hypothetical protein